MPCLPHSVPPWARLWGRIVLPVLVGAIGAWLGMAVWAGTTVEMGPFEVRLDSGFGRGVTDIRLPPLGELSADTHRAPLRFSATLLDVKIPELTQAITDRGLDSLVAEIEADAKRDVVMEALKVLGVTTLTAGVLALLAFRLDWHRVLTALLACLLLVGGTEILAVGTFRPRAFGAPTFSGSLRLAAQVIPPGRTVQALDAFQEQLARVLQGAVNAYTSIQTNPVGRAGEIRVLHISDVHLNPLGFSFAQQIAEGFDVDFVIDTGDTTSFGSTPENFVLSDIRAFDRPYVWVRGNHDSRSFQRAVGRLPNTLILDGNTTLLHGIRIYGLGHPVPPSITRTIPDDVFAQRARKAGERVLSDIEQLPPVDVVAVHDDRMAGSVAGRVPLVLSGHFHETASRVEDGTLYLRIGTTGSSALTTFEPSANIPLSAEVLYFQPGTPPVLIAYDVIEQNPKTGDLTVTRHVIQDEFGDLSPSPPAPTPSGTGLTGTAAPPGTSPTPLPSPTPTPVG
ncbi:MAG: metallophosphoesterase [Candidatus Velamenicoccus archaeovorus]